MIKSNGDVNLARILDAGNVMAQNEHEKCVGKFLVSRRNQLKLTTGAVADAADISASYYRAIEHGSTPPNSTLIRILRALQFEATEFRQLLELAAIDRGLSRADAGLPDDVAELIGAIRKSALTLPATFVRALRTKIREVAE